MNETITSLKEGSYMANMMLVDDSDFMRRMLKEELVNLGHTVVAETVSGDASIRLYIETRPEFVFMDVKMPGGNGIAKVREIRALSPDVKIVVYSAIRQHALFLEAIHAGATDFIVKPINKDRLAYTLEKHLQPKSQHSAGGI